MKLKEIRDRSGVLRSYSSEDGVVHTIASAYKKDDAGNPTHELEDGIEIIPMTDAEVAEVKIKAEAAEAEWASTQYQKDRAKEYPPITDYIDGVVKGDQAQIDAYIAACQAVKAKYPKG